MSLYDTLAFINTSTSVVLFVQSGMVSILLSQCNDEETKSPERLNNLLKEVSGRAGTTPCHLLIVGLNLPNVCFFFFFSILVIGLNFNVFKVVNIISQWIPRKIN